MRSFGLDLSTVSTGWSVFDGSKLVRSGKLVPTPSAESMERIYSIAKEVALLAEANSPDKVVIEDVFYGRNYLTTKVLNRLAGAVYFALRSVLPSGVGVIFVTPTHARKCMGLLPSSKKRHIVDAVNRKFGRELRLSDNDEADAIVLGYYGWYEDNEPDESFKKTEQKFFKTSVRPGVKTRRLGGKYKRSKNG